MYRANWALQTDGAASVSTAIATMESELDAINSQVSALMGQWDSDSQAAYLARQQTWNSAADNIRNALMMFTRGLSNSAELSQGAEQTNVGVVSA